MAKTNAKDKVTPDAIEEVKEEVTPVTKKAKNTAPDVAEPEKVEPEKAEETVEEAKAPAEDVKDEAVEESDETESDEFVDEFEEEEIPLEGIDSPGFINRVNTLWVPPVLRDR